MLYFSLLEVRQVQPSSDTNVYNNVLPSQIQVLKDTLHLKV